MGNWEGLNRRQFPRINYPCLIVIRNNVDNDAEDTLLTHTDNLGIGGVCVALKQSVKMFKVVEIELDLLDLEEHICCKGKVVWNVERKQEDDSKSKLFDIGIEFMNVNKADQERLNKVVDRLSKNKK